MPATVTSIAPRRASGPGRAPVKRDPPRRPFRDNPRLILAGIGVLVGVLDRAAGDRQRHVALLARFPQRVRALRAVGGRPDDARGARLRAGAQHRQAGGRAAAGAAVRAVPRQAGRAAARHDAGAGRARADRRQRADSHEHRPLVQRADGGDPVVGESDRGRLLPRAADAGERSREPSRAHAGRGRSHEHRRPSDSRRAGARRDAAAGPDGGGLPRRAVGRIADEPGVGRRRGRAGAAAWLQPRGRGSSGRPGARRIGGSALDGNAWQLGRNAARGGGHSRQGRPSERRGGGDRVSHRRSRRTIAPHDASLRKLQPAARAEAAAHGPVSVVLPDGHAADSVRRDVDGLLPGQAHHPPGPDAGGGGA